MTSLKHHLRKLPKITKSEACSRFLNHSSSSSDVDFQQETESAGASPCLEAQVTRGNATPYSPSCSQLYVSEDDDDIKSASQETVEDQHDVVVEFIDNPLSSYLSNWKFMEFLQAWQACDGACAHPNDVDDGNDNVEGVNDCRKSKSSTRNVFADALPYSPSCEFKAPARGDEDDVINKSVERMKYDYVVSPDCKNKTNFGGDTVARSSTARTPSYSGSLSDFDFGGPGGDSPDSIPSSAAELTRNSGVSKVKRMGKLNRIERVSSEVKIALDPFYKKKAIDKNEYKYILKGAVTKIYRAKNKPIVHSIIKSFVESYVHKIQIRRNAGRDRF